MPAKALSAPPTFGQKLARRLHGIIDAIFTDAEDPDALSIAGQVFGGAGADLEDPAYREQLGQRLAAQEKERREMAVVHETRYILQAQTGVAGNYVAMGDLAGHFKSRTGPDRVELERILAFRGEPYFERLGERLYLKGHVNG